MTGRGSEMAWGGRFDAPPADGLLDFSRSVEVDSRLWREDIDGSLAHIGALVDSGVVTSEEAESLRSGLRQVAAEFEAGGFEFLPWDEDVHMAIERRLTELIGEVGAKLHSGRSRNDQVVLDLRLFVRREAASVASALLELASALLGQAESAGDALLPGYTHLQRAQPVLLAHHLLAHVWPLTRDAARLVDVIGRANVSPLGAAALSGSSLQLDPAIAARELEMPLTFENSMDAVADRDFAADYLYACAIGQIHMSRLAEELIVWASDEFGFVRLPDEWATGSSMMPQKKNPDVAELTRGKSGRAIGNLVTLLTVLKGLPLTYNRDLQEDKEPVFDSTDTVKESARAMTGLVSTLTFDTAQMQRAVTASFSTATDLAEELVRRGVPFRSAHAAVGRFLSELERDGRDMSSLTPDDLASLVPEGEPISPEILTPRAAVDSRNQPGMTGPARVAEALAAAREAIESLEAILGGS